MLPHLSRHWVVFSALAVPAGLQVSAAPYPFTLVELRIGPDGKGEGRLSLAATITADEQAGTIVLENYRGQPVHLTGVRRERGR